MEQELSEKKFDYLIHLEKKYVGTQKFKYPIFGGKLIIDLISTDRNENFILDISRSHIQISKNSLQHRARKTIILVRLDINSAPHKNPDGKMIHGTHLHIYRENYADKFAYELPDEFKSCKDINDFLTTFMDYCHITMKPIIEKELFV